MARAQGAWQVASFFDTKTPGSLLSETALGFYIFAAVIIIAVIAWVGFEIQIRRIRAREQEDKAGRDRDETS